MLLIFYLYYDIVFVFENCSKNDFVNLVYDLLKYYEKTSQFYILSLPANQFSMTISFFGDPQFDSNWLDLVCHDPVHPHLNIIKRISANRTIAVAIEDETPQFIVCIRIGNKLPKNMEEVLVDDQSKSKFDITNAVLYSIFKLPNCTTKGVGPKVIKAVLQKLKEKGVERIYTLSPIPMLSKHFTNMPSEGEVRSYLEKWIGPVEKFHLSNGARIQSINMNADSSELRQNESWGVMVNYDYNGLIQ